MDDLDTDIIDNTTKQASKSYINKGYLFAFLLSVGIGAF